MGCIVVIAKSVEDNCRLCQKYNSSRTPPLLLVHKNKVMLLILSNEYFELLETASSLEDVSTCITTIVLNIVFVISRNSILVLNFSFTAQSIFGHLFTKG